VRSRRNPASSFPLVTVLVLGTMSVQSSSTCRVPLLLGGGGPPRDVMTGAMHTLSDVLPLSHVIGGLRQSWLGTTDDPHTLWWPLLVAAVAGWRSRCERRSGGRPEPHGDGRGRCLGGELVGLVVQRAPRRVMHSIERCSPWGRRRAAA
jgi:hypothetical protein